MYGFIVFFSVGPHFEIPQSTLSIVYILTFWVFSLINLISLYVNKLNFISTAIE